MLKSERSDLQKISESKKMLREKDYERYLYGVGSYVVPL